MPCRVSCVLVLVLSFSWVHAGDVPRPKIVVKIHDENPTVVDADLPVDPVQRIRMNSPNQGLMIGIQDEMGRMLHLSHFPSFQIDGQLLHTFNGVMKFEPVEVPKTASGQPWVGHIKAFRHGDLRITQRAEVVATKSPAPGQKRRRDAVLIRYTVENKGTQPRRVGVRTYMDAYIINNDGALFAAPTFPGKVLNGIELKDKTLPDYVQILQQPDLKNPGFVAHLTLSLGGSVEKANRVVLTRHGLGFNTWEMPAVQAVGDSALGVFWDAREIKPGGKREVAYAYGQGIAASPEGEGPFQVALGGSFEPGKTFTVAVTVGDPAPAQVLTLELPAGMERVEGKEVQPVPIRDEGGQALVLWKVRVLQTGNFPLRVRSSTGLTQTKVVSISASQAP